MFLLFNSSLTVLDVDCVNDTRHSLQVDLCIDHYHKTIHTDFMRLFLKDVISDLINLFFTGGEKDSMSVISVADSDNGVEFARSEKGK
jgi:hypothetical protein